jgi:predicted RNA binding protein YcfA (HicA-like mRNA interferase family)
MSKLPQITAREMMAALQRAGFSLARSKGSHHFMVHKDDPARWATVAMHRGDMRNDTVRDILKQAQITREEFLDLL